jgi:hypothetical protein
MLAWAKNNTRAGAPAGLPTQLPRRICRAAARRRRKPGSPAREIRRQLRALALPLLCNRERQAQAAPPQL